MHFRTMATLDRLEKASWFSRVGINEGFSVAVVRTWSEAIYHCGSSAWEDLQGEALNQYREYIAHRSKDRLQLWNGAFCFVGAPHSPSKTGINALVAGAHALRTSGRPRGPPLRNHGRCWT
jgi:hypothetical protein